MKNRKLFSVCSNRMMIVSDPDTGKVIASLKVSGTFHPHHKESGKVKITYPSAPSCDGSAGYSTKAA